MDGITFKQVNKYFHLHHQKTLKELVHEMFTGGNTIERVQALKDISFHIKSGETVGIIGRNGAGKSTLLKLIAGVSFPTEGTINIEGKVAPLIELGAGFHPELTGMENIYLNGVILGLSENYIKTRVRDIIDFSEIENRFIHMPVKHYSSGMYMRLAFSVAIFTNPEILLVDEIIAVGDVAFQRKCMNKMDEFKKQGKTIIYVSHSLETVDRFCDRVLYLKHGNIIYDGDSKKGLDHYRNDIE